MSVGRGVTETDASPRTEGGELTTPLIGPAKVAEPEGNQHGAGGNRTLVRKQILEGPYVRSVVINLVRRVFTRRHPTNQQQLYFAPARCGSTPGLADFIYARISSIGWETERTASEISIELFTQP